MCKHILEVACLNVTKLTIIAARTEEEQFRQTAQYDGCMSTKDAVRTLLESFGIGLQLVHAAYEQSGLERMTLLVCS